MNPIHTIRRLVCMLAGLAVALVAAVAVAPAAFAQPPIRLPGPPAEVVQFGPAAHAVNGVTGDMTGWQIVLIAVGGRDSARHRRGAPGPGTGSPRSPARHGRLNW